MPLPAGTRLGPYEVVAALGAGGMGEVYRARDTKLNRDVALKILPEQFANQPERVARFEREAHLLASLNHPHIAQIYAVENLDGIRALAMELVPGRTLGEAIGAGLSLTESLAIARQIAGALEAAHEKGIIHRDLKPGNVMITPEGEVKLLDFGLGKSLAAEAEGDISDSPTMTAAATQMGVLLGTAAYMSPEQAKGRVVDKRSDIWAFGCVLYEMLTGQRAFAGEDVSETLAAILRGEPDWNALPADTPPHIRRLLQRCLEKERRRRLRDIGDVLLELDDAGASAAVPGLGIAAAPTRTRDLAWLAALVVVGASIGAAGWWLRAPAELPETRLDIVAPQTDNASFALSPDGRQVVFVAPSGGRNMLWLRSLDAAVARPLAGTEGGTNPFWSPDSKSIGFVAGAKLKRLDLAGGAPQTLGDASGVEAGGAWSPSNVILYRTSVLTVLLRIPASGGESVPTTKLTDGTTAHSQPEFLPDGRQFLFFANGSDNARGIYLGSLDNQGVRRLTDADGPGRYVKPGWLAYIRQGTLVARRFDLAGHSLSGDAVVIADMVFSFSVSAQGLLAYRMGSQPRRQLTWFDRSGKALGTLGQADEAIVAPALSPDGGRVAVNRSVQGNRDIWVIDALRTTRLTFDPADDNFPLWSPDGARIAFGTARNGKVGVYAKSANGAGAEELVAERPASLMFFHPTSWSRDGRFILVDVNTATNSPEVWVLPLTGDRPSTGSGRPELVEGRKAYPFLNGSHQERLALFSPDGHWVAYQSNESGRAEIYVRPFPGPGGQWQVSTAGGAGPRWRNDGKELYWISSDAKLMAAPISVMGSSIEPGAPVALFQTRIHLGGRDNPFRGQYNVAPDGRFLINTVLFDGAVMPITLVQNWRGGK